MVMAKFLFFFPCALFLANKVSSTMEFFESNRDTFKLNVSLMFRNNNEYNLDLIGYRITVTILCICYCNLSMFLNYTSKGSVKLINI